MQTGWEDGGLDSLDGFVVCCFFSSSLLLFFWLWFTVWKCAYIIHVVCRGFYSFLIPSSGWTKGREGVFWKNPNLIHTRQKHNTIIASVSELGADCPSSSRENGKARKHDFWVMFFLRLVPVLLLVIIIIFLVGCAICWSLMSWGFSIFSFYFSTFRACFAN